MLGRQVFLAATARRRILSLLAIFDRLIMKYIMLILCAALAVSGNLPAAPVSQKQTAQLTMSGAWAIYPLAQKWGEAFQKQNPGVRLNISAGGAGKGMADVLTGAVDIGMVSREIDPSEKARGAAPTMIAKDGVFAIISSHNPARQKILRTGVSRKMLADIFITQKLNNWKQLGGPDAPIHVYTRSDACGAGSAWAATLGKYKQDQIKGIGIYGDPGIMEAVKKDVLGIGFCNLGFVFTKSGIEQGIYLVPIDANENGNADSVEFIDTRGRAYQAVASGKYPGARREFFVTKGKPTGLSAAFIRFSLSDEGMQILKEVGGYVPLTPSERAVQLNGLK